MLKKVLFLIVGFILLCIIILLGINASIIAKSSNNIVDVNVSNDLTADCILVLGASVYSNDTPSPMLKDRLDMGIHLYNNSFLYYGYLGSYQLRSGVRQTFFRSEDGTTCSHCSDKWQEIL